MLSCGSCAHDEYCGFSSGHPRCEKCTICPAGFFLVAQCSVHADRICQVSSQHDRLVIKIMMKLCVRGQKYVFMETV